MEKSDHDLQEQCSVCHHPVIHFINSRISDGKFYCQCCYEEIYRHCDSCSEEVHCDDVHFAGRKIYCEHCFFDSFFYCENCNEVHHNDYRFFTMKKGRAQNKVFDPQAIFAAAYCEDCYEIVEARRKKLKLDYVQET